MKRTGCLIFLLVSLTASAQITVTDTVIRFGVTQKGKPHGEKTEIKISKEGGSLQSSDGKVELIFPAGAVTKKNHYQYSARYQPCTQWRQQSLPNGTIRY